jgi:tetratricopeptide (TPR) repeat protein
MTRSRVFSSAVLAAVAASVLPGLMAPVTSAQAADKPTIRPELAKPLQAAQEDLKSKKPQQALEEIAKTDATGSKTAYENYVVAEMRQAAYAQLNDTAGFARAAEASIATGMASPEERLKDDEILAGLAYQAKDYAKAIDYGTRYYKDGGTDPKYHTVIAQAYYLTNDFPGAAKAIRSIIKDSGGKPTEEQLQLLLSAEAKGNPGGPGYFDALTLLTQYYPKKDYWHDLILAVSKKPGMADKLAGEFDQLNLATGVYDKPNDFMEAAQTALQSGYPGTAKTILNKGYSSGALGQGAEAARQKRLVDMTDHQAADDQHTLAQNAAIANSGTPLLKLGDAYYSYGQTDKAIDAYTKALQKNDFKSPLDQGMVKIHLANAYMLSGQKAKAKEQLIAVTSPDVMAGIAKCWLLYYQL